MRSIGQGYPSICKFTALMNMPRPMAQKNYDRSVNKITMVVKEIAEGTMTDDPNELKEENDLADVSVSCDGTWQRIGH